MTKEYLTPTAMKDLLISKGVIFFPRRNLIIPTFSDVQLYSHFNSGHITDIRENVFEIRKFLSGQAVGDSFGKDHLSRRVWRQKMYTQFGEVFQKVYSDNNQFRGNFLGLVRLDILDFAQYASDPDQSQCFENIGHYLTQALNNGLLSNGRIYNEIESLDEKLRIVHAFEDKAIEALQLIAN